MPRGKASLAPARTVIGTTTPNPRPLYNPTRHRKPSSALHFQGPPKLLSRSTTHECCAHECCDEMTNFSQIEAALRERSPGLGHTQNGVYHTHHGNEARGAETLGCQDRGAGPWRCAVREGAAARARCALRQSAPKLLCQRGDRPRELRDGCGAA